MIFTSGPPRSFPLWLVVTVVVNVYRFPDLTPGIAILRVRAEYETSRIRA